MANLIFLGVPENKTLPAYIIKCKCDSAWTLLTVASLIGRSMMSLKARPRFFKWGEEDFSGVPSFLTCAGSLCSTSGSDYPRRWRISPPARPAASSQWWSSVGLWPSGPTAGPATAWFWISGSPLRLSGWSLLWLSPCQSCKDKNQVLILWPKKQSCGLQTLMCSSLWSEHL